MNIQSKIICAEPIQLSNISVGGACIITETPLNSGNNVLIRMNRSRIRHPLLGSVIWESRSGVELYGSGPRLPAYRAGIQFKSIPPGTLVQLKDFMRIAGVPEDKPYVETSTSGALRYVIASSEGAVLNYPKICAVKKISLGGMLVEINGRLEVERRYPMALYLPNDGQPIKFTGRIVSQTQLPAGGSSLDTGIEFHDLSEHGKTLLKRFIASLLWIHKA